MKTLTVKRSGSITLPRVDVLSGLVTFVIFASVVFLSVYQLQPPGTVPASAPLTEFSADRAMQHLQVIAQQPHPIGSPEQRKVRAYIVQELDRLGLEPEVQKELVEQRSQFITVYNIVARLKGTDNTKAIMLVAHYDTVPTSPGASDDGAAVVAILETARALKASSSLRNDVIFLFTDGEEGWMLGARAFVDKHPWAKDVGLVLNFEARGTSGPSLMFETSDNNGWLISEFAKAAPYPVANSLMYDVYKLLPNNTDFTIFKGAGFAGFNFAYINDLNHYHSPNDNLEAIDERSLQHHGIYSLSLIRHFGDLDLQHTRSNDVIYFNIIRPIFIYYPVSWSIPLAVLVSLLFIGTVALGFRKRQLTASGIILGFLIFLLSLVIAPMAVTLIWQTALTITRSNPAAYTNGLYMIALASFTIAITSVIYVRLGTRISSQNLTVGGLLWWLILAILIGRYLPGGSYLTTWPLLFSLIGIGFVFASKDTEMSLKRSWFVLSLCAIPGIILFTSTIYLIFTAMTLRLCAALMALVVIATGLLIPHFKLMATPHKWLLPSVATLIGLGLMMAGTLRIGT